MLNVDVIRAWKDEAYRLGLSQEEQALLPEHPAGIIELRDADLNAAGADSDDPLYTEIPMQCTEVTVRCPSICQVFSC